MIVHFLMIDKSDRITPMEGLMITAQWNTIDRRDMIPWDLKPCANQPIEARQGMGLYQIRLEEQYELASGELVYLQFTAPGAEVTRMVIDPKERGGK